MSIAVSGFVSIEAWVLSRMAILSPAKGDTMVWTGRVCVAG
jgi:hypothetical protein